MKLNKKDVPRAHTRRMGPFSLLSPSLPSSLAIIGWRWLATPGVGHRWLAWAFAGLRWPAPAVVGFLGLVLAGVGCRWPSLAGVGFCWPALASACRNLVRS
jgi:hypothetical protein